MTLPSRPKRMVCPSKASEIRKDPSAVSTTREYGLPKYWSVPSRRMSPKGTTAGPTAWVGFLAPWSLSEHPPKKVSAPATATGSNHDAQKRRGLFISIRQARSDDPDLRKRIIDESIEQVVPAGGYDHIRFTASHLDSRQSVDHRYREATRLHRPFVDASCDPARAAVSEGLESARESRIRINAHSHSAVAEHLPASRAEADQLGVQAWGSSRGRRKASMRLRRGVVSAYGPGRLSAL